MRTKKHSWVSGGDMYDEKNNKNGYISKLILMNMLSCFFVLNTHKKVRGKLLGFVLPSSVKHIPRQ